jgi:outer membrane protein X
MRLKFINSSIKLDIMKKTIFFYSLLFITVSNSLGQSVNYKAFKVDLGMLYAFPSDASFDGGAGFYLEPKYNLTDNVALGLRLETALLALNYIDPVDLSIHTVAASLSSYAATIDYYVTEKYFRPFVGMGIGLYQLSVADISLDVTGPNVTVSSEPHFGFVPRIGVLIGHFRLALAYNVITGVEEEFGANYMAIKIGWEIGGGKKVSSGDN